MTFGRSAGGGRSVYSEWIVGLSRPFDSPDATSPAAGTQDGTGSASSQSGSAWAGEASARKWRPRPRDRGRTDEADQDAGERRPAEHADAPRALEERVRAGH